MRVSEAMHRGVEWSGPDVSVREIARIMRDKDIGAIPIGENDKLIGMVTDRDIVTRGITEQGDVSNLTARDVMNRGIVYCKDSQELGEAARLMEEKQVRRLVAIDENKRMVGILSLGDISHRASSSTVAEFAEKVSAPH